MTNFKDFVRSEHFDLYKWDADGREDDFDKWKEELTNRELSGYLIDYLNTLSEKWHAQLAYEILQNQ